MDNPKSAHSFVVPLAAIGLSLAIFLVYIVTAAPSAWWGDGMELTVAATTRGIAHPTGYPVYTVLGHTLIKLVHIFSPTADPGRIMTLMSAAMLAISCGLLTLFFRDRLREFSGSCATPAHDASEKPTHPCNCASHGILPAAGLALIVAFMSTVWDHATFTEVYPFTFLLAVLMLHIVWTPDAATPPTWKCAALLGAVVGLSALNQYSISAMGPICLFTTLAWGWSSRSTQRQSSKDSLPRRFLPLATMLAVAIPIVAAGWCYLLLRARSNPLLNWGDPSNFHRLVWTLTGGQFREIKVETTSTMVFSGLWHWLHWWGAQWLPERLEESPLALLLGIVALTAAIAGHLWIATRRPALGLGLIGAIAMTALFAATYHILDIDPFFMVGLPAAAIGWLAAALALLQIVRRNHERLGHSPAAHSLPAIAALALLAIHFGDVNKSWDIAPTQWGEAAMAALPKDAIVLTEGDQSIYALWYQQMALGQRPDVSIIGANFIFQGWYQRFFEAPTRPKIAMLAQDRPLTQTPKYIYDQAVIERILIPNFAAGRRIFITYHDPTLMNYFSPFLTGLLMTPEYPEITQYYELGLPDHGLYELHPNPDLAAMPPAKRTQILEAFNMQHAMDEARAAHQTNRAPLQR